MEITAGAGRAKNTVGTALPTNQEIGIPLIHAGSTARFAGDGFETVGEVET